MNCDDCKWAWWKRTANDRLHPDKSGECMRLKSHPLDMRIPAAFYWISGPSRPAGGFIERGRELREKCIFKDTSR